MRQEKKFEEQMDYHDNFGNKMSLMSRWSIYEGDDVFGVRYEGSLKKKSPFVPGTVIRNQCKVWGYDTSAVVGGEGTWADLWLACDSVIRNATDEEGNRDHHVFIEGFERMDSGEYRVITGS
jgi:hypothetical protein